MSNDEGLTPEGIDLEELERLARESTNTLWGGWGTKVEYLVAARPEVVLALIERVRAAEAASRVTPAQRDAVADHIWDQMVGVAKTSVREVVADAFLGAGIDVDRPDHPQESCTACGHASDCSTHNEPALPAGPCDCSKRVRS